MNPISAPCTTKIAMIEDGDAPSVRRIAMSACLSVTTITCAETMLNAATATISVRMMNITRFSICTARKKFAWLRVQSRISAWTGSFCHEVARDGRRRKQIVELEPDARHALEAVELLRVLDVHEREAAVELRHADVEDADHLEALEARQRAGRRDGALRRDHDDGVARHHAERAREVAAEHDAELAGLEVRKGAARACACRCRPPRLRAKDRCRG